MSLLNRKRGVKDLDELEEARSCITFLPQSPTMAQTGEQNIVFTTMRANSHVGRGWTVVPLGTRVNLKRSVRIEENMRDWQSVPPQDFQVNLMAIATAAKEKRNGVLKDYEVVKNPIQDVVAFNTEVVENQPATNDFTISEWVEVESTEPDANKSEGVQKMSYSDAARAG